MKINDSIDKILGIYKKQPVQNNKAGKISEASGVTASDRVELSEKARDFHAILKAAKGVPEVRQEKVTDIKTRIETGRYNVSTADTAQKILEGLMFDKKV